MTHSVDPPNPGWWMASDGQWYAPEFHPDALAGTGPAVPPAAAAPNPGWWMASDGRWYPPEQHPTAAAVVPVAPVTPEAVPYFATPTQFGPTPQYATTTTSTSGYPFPAQDETLTNAPWDLARTDDGSTLAMPAPSAIPPIASDPPPSSDVHEFFAPARSISTYSKDAKPFWKLREEEDESAPNHAGRNWEKKLHQGKRVGVRTVRSATNFLIRSCVLATLYIAVLVIAIKNPDSWWLLIGAPMMYGFRYLIGSHKRQQTGLITETIHRSNSVGIGGGWASWTPREARFMQSAAIIAIVGVIAGVVANVMIINAQFFSTKGKAQFTNLGDLIQGVPQSTTSTVPVVVNGTTSTTTSTTVVPGMEDSTQNTAFENEINNALKGG